MRTPNQNFKLRHKLKHVIFLTALANLLTSCFAPVNLNYESAKNLKKGEVSFQGNYSKYATGDKNFGGKLTYGVSDRYNVKLRYERMYSNFLFDLGEFGLTGIPDNFAINYFELENKFGSKSGNFATGLPIGYYSGLNALMLDPRIYFTLRDKHNKVELNVIPKMHVFIAGNGIQVIPALSGGIGLSSNLDKWAIRPEVGYDIILSYGISLTVNIAAFSHKVKKNRQSNAT